MANIISLNAISKEFAGKQLFSNLSFGIEENDHIGLIGPNGAGKSTLLKILNQEVEQDKGTIARKSGLKVGFLSQVPQFKDSDTLISAITDDLKGHEEDWEKQMKALEVLSLLNLEEEGYDPET